MNEEKCPYCGGSEIIANILVGSTTEVGNIGLSYTSAMILLKAEPFVADLCTECGSVIRVRVHNTGRKWRILNP